MENSKRTQGTRVTAKLQIANKGDGNQGFHHEEDSGDKRENGFLVGKCVAFSTAAQVSTEYVCNTGGTWALDALPSGGERPPLGHCFFFLSLSLVEVKK